MDNDDRNKLPESVVRVKMVPLDQYNPVELDALASQPSRTVALPPGKRSPGAEIRMRNLAQYKGRSPEGTKRSLANLRRRVVDTIVEVVPPQLPATVPPPTQPEIKANVPEIDAIKRKYIRSILSREEFDLYISTWGKWFKDHPDFNQVEDQADVHTICMEEVIQYRVQLLKQRFPKTDYAKEYNQSFDRGQKARENLAARRVDRIQPTKGPGGGNTVINVAVLAGQVDDKRLLDYQRKQRKQLADDMDFLERGTNATTPDDIVDVESTPVQEKAQEQAPAPETQK